MSYGADDVRVLVAAHPRRAKRATTLARNVKGEIVWDPYPNEPPSALRTYYRALREGSYDRGCATLPGGHTLILQDDAVPCPDMLSMLPAIITRHSTKIISLYVGHVHACKKDMLREYRRGRRYVRLPLKHFIPTVALIWPNHVARSFLSYLDEYAVTIPQDDEAIMGWRIDQYPEAVTCVGTIPSIVRHNTKVPSLMHPHHGERDALIPWQAWEKRAPWETGW